MSEEIQGIIRKRDAYILARREGERTNRFTIQKTELATKEVCARELIDFISKGKPLTEKSDYYNGMLDACAVIKQWGRKRNE